MDVFEKQKKIIKKKSKRVNELNIEIELFLKWKFNVEKKRIPDTKPIKLYPFVLLVNG